MKISFTRDAFMDVAAILSIADDGKHGGALFRTGGGTVTVMASDGTIFLRGIMAANVTEAGSVVLDLKKIDSICKAADGELIQIDVQDQKGTLVAGKSKYKLLTLSESTYPEEPSFKDMPMATIRPSVLTEAVAKVLPCINEKHYSIFQGCYFVIGADVKFVGTNNVQVAELVRQTEKPLIKAVGGVASVRTIQAAAKIANAIMESDGEHTMLVGISQGTFVAQADDFRLVAPLLQGDFPKYEGIFLNKEEPVGVGKIVSDKLAGVLSRAGLAIAKVGEVAAEFSPTSLTVRVGHKDSPDFIETVEVIGRGDPLVRTYNLRQLASILASIPEGNEVNLEFGAPERPLQITYAGDPGWRYVTAPILNAFE